MFKSTSTLKRESAERQIESALNKYYETKNSWYDGSLDSVNTRVAYCEEVLGKLNSSLLHTGSFVSQSEELSHELTLLASFQEQLISEEGQRLAVNVQTPFHKNAFKQLPRVAQKWVVLESKKFIRSNREVEADHDELMERASSYVIENTNQLPDRQLQLLTAAFQKRIVDTLTSGAG